MVHAVFTALGENEGETTHGKAARGRMCVHVCFIFMRCASYNVRRIYVSDASSLTWANKFMAKPEKSLADTRALTQAVVPKDPEKA